jgi:hypothetical protein
MYSDVPNRLRARLRTLAMVLDLLFSVEIVSSDQAHGSHEAAIKVSSKLSHGAGRRRAPSEQQ